MPPYQVGRHSFESQVEVDAYRLGRQDTTAALREMLEGKRREQIATQVLGGFAALPEWGMATDSPALAAEAAVEWADALIAELDKPKEVKP
jgi:hypothetical protein